MYRDFILLFFLGCLNIKLVSHHVCLSIKVTCLPISSHSLSPSVLIIRKTHLLSPTPHPDPLLIPVICLSLILPTVLHFSFFLHSSLRGGGSDTYFTFYSTFKNITVCDRPKKMVEVMKRKRTVKQRAKEGSEN